jgi:hypothetical protein
MTMSRVMEGVYVVAMGTANGYLIDQQHGLTLIDAGFPKKEEAVFAALRQLGRAPQRAQKPDPDAWPPRPHRQCGGDCARDGSADIHASARRAVR